MSVISYLDNLSSLLNIADREANSITRSIDTIDSRLRNHFTSALKERFRFGSSTRKTMLPRTADSRSDVDFMVVFENSLGYKPQTYISWLKQFAETYYSRSEIYQSTPTVVLELGHIKFDLVPGYRSWSSLFIPAPASSYLEWISADPLSFNITIDQANTATNYQLKPLIRLLKYWNAKNDRVFESYDLEQKLATVSYYYCSNLRDYLNVAINGLYSSRWGLPAYKQEKVDRAKRIMDDTLSYERNNAPYAAESEIKKLLPDL